MSDAEEWEPTPFPDRVARRCFHPHPTFEVGGKNDRRPLLCIRPVEVSGRSTHTDHYGLVGGHWVHWSD